jgi:hypothetical protein
VKKNRRQRRKGEQEETEENILESSKYKGSIRTKRRKTKARRKVEKRKYNKWKQKINLEIKSFGEIRCQCLVIMSQWPFFATVNSFNHLFNIYRTYVVSSLSLT